jgi:transcriptional regulator with XRE-family HTH domain
MIRQARLEAGLSLEALATRTEIDHDRLEAFELGDEPLPLPELEALSGILGRSIREFQDQYGPIGVWNAQQRALQNFLSLPLELQLFIAKPVNRPYLELAVRLSDMSVEKLRAVAEGLLEITY